jgi:hypothetical protein
MDAIAAAAIAKMSGFDESQGIANMAWAFSKLAVNDEPLRDALSAAALAKLSSFGPQGLANLVWSLSSLL